MLVRLLHARRLPLCPEPGMCGTGERDLCAGRGPNRPLRRASPPAGGTRPARPPARPPLSGRRPPPWRAQPPPRLTTTTTSPTSSTTMVTTTTLPGGVCGKDADCEDGNPCTAGGCLLGDC